MPISATLRLSLLRCISVMVLLVGGSRMRGQTIVTEISGETDSSNYSIPSAGSLTLSLAYGSATASGAISGIGSLVVQAGSGTLTLSGSNSYFGKTTLSSGTLRVSSASNLGPEGEIDISNATLEATASFFLDSRIVPVGPTTILVDSGKTLTLENLAGAGSTTVTKSGSGTLLLYDPSGPVLVSAGTLAIRGSYFSGPLTINDTTVELSGSDSGATGPYTQSLSVPVTLNGGGTIEVDSQVTGNFSNTISGTGGLTAAGPGILVLAGTNTYAGGTTVAGGTLQVSRDANLGVSGAGITIGAGTFETTIGFATSRPVALNGGSIAVDSGQVTTLSGVLSGSGGLNKSNSGTLVLSGETTYTGLTTIDNGSLQLGAGGTTGSIAGTVTDNGTLVFDHSDAVSFSGTISGLGGVSQIGSGTLALTGTNSYFGGTSVTAGTLKVSSSVNLGAISSKLTLASGTLEIAGGANLSQGITLTGPGTIVVDSGQVATLSGAITGAGSLVVQAGSGTLTLSGSNSYFGKTTLSSGTLRVSSASNLGPEGEIDINNATLEATASFFLESRIVPVGSATILVDSGKTLTLENLAGAGSTTVTKSGSGTLLLYDPSGPVLVSTGTLAIRGSYFSGPLTINGATVELSGSDSGATGPYTQSLSVPVILNGGGTIEVDSQVTGNFSNTISGTGGLVTTGLGTLVLSGTNTYSGGTMVTGGTLQVSRDANLGIAGAGIMIGAGTLETTSGITISRPVTLSGGGSIAVDSGQITTFSGILSGSGGLTKSNSGTLELSAANTYTGDTTVSSGTLIAAHNGQAGTFAAGTNVIVDAGATLVTTASDALGWGSGNANLVINGGTVTTDASTAEHTTLQNVVMTGGLLTSPASDGQFLLNGPLVTRASSTTATINSPILQILPGATAGPPTSFTVSKGSTASGIDLAINSSIVGSGSLVKNGLGTLQLTANNTYSGGTTINAGTLAVNGSTAYDGLVTVNSGATLRGRGAVGELLVASGGILAPGDGLGTLSARNTTLGGGGALHFEVDNAAAGAGAGYSLLAINGSLTLAASAVNPFTIDVSGRGENFNGSLDYSLMVATTTTGIAGFSTDEFAVDTTRFQNSDNGFWSVELVDGGKDLELNYAGVGAVPEPSTYGAIAGLMGLGFVVVLRRRSSLTIPGTTD